MREFNSPKFLMRFALFGQKEHGKTTFANALVDELNRLMFLSGDYELLKSVEANMQYARESFTRPLKDMMNSFFGLSLRDIEKYKNKPEFIPPGWTVNVRTALEKMGKTVREIYPECCTDLICNDTRNIVIDDGRLDSEVDKCNELGFNTVLVYRPEKTNKTPTTKFESDMLKYYQMIERGEYSEVERKFCGVVFNESTEESLIQSAKDTASIHINIIKEELIKRAN